MKKRLIIPGVILLLAVLLSIGTYFYRLEQYKDWTTAPGVVTDVTIFRANRISSSTHRIHYTFIVNDISYTGSESFSGKTDIYETGDPHEIWFDPENPALSSFYKPTPGLDPIGPLMFGSFLAIASYITVEKNEKRSKLC